VKSLIVRGWSEMKVKVAGGGLRMYKGVCRFVMVVGLMFQVEVDVELQGFFPRVDLG
jgi:hypothetical protein